MEDDVRKLIEEKATEVGHFLHTAGYIHTYRLIEYGVNFSLRYMGGEHTLTLSYSPKRRQWNPYSVNEWTQNVVIPLIQPLLGHSQWRASEPVVSPIRIAAATTIGVDHFAEASRCLQVLEPFANDNIDFSIICDFARRGVQRALNDPTFAYLDRASLQFLLDQPLQSDFIGAKEYFLLCQTQCSIQTGS